MQQFSFEGPHQTDPYRSELATVPNTYVRMVNSKPKVEDMNVRRGTVSWDAFKFVVTGLLTTVSLLLTALCTVLWVYLSGIREGVNGVRRDLSDVRVEFTKAVGGVEKQVAITNGKLNMLIEQRKR